MKRFAAYGLVAIGMLFVAVLAGVFSGARAVAQTAIKAALVKNVDEKGRVPFQYQRGCSSGDFNGCSFTYPTVPAGKRLVVEHVSGSILGFSTATSDPIILLCRCETSILPEYARAELPAFRQAPGPNWGVNAPTLAYFEEGSAPSIVVTQIPPAIVQLNIVGYLIDKSL